MLQKLTKLLNITEDDNVSIAKLDIVLDLVKDRVLAYIDEEAVPKSLEWVVVEATIKRFQLLGSEHLTSASVEGLNASYNTNNLLSDYKEFLDGYVLSKEEPKQASAKKVRLL